MVTIVLTHKSEGFITELLGNNVIIAGEVKSKTDDVRFLETIIEIQVERTFFHKIL